MDIDLSPRAGAEDLEDRLAFSSASSSPSGFTSTPNGRSELDEVRAWFARFVSTMNDDDLDLLAVWAVHTHLVVETYTTPRLLLDSPVPGSGKTTTLEHLQRLCFKPVLMSAVSSSAMLARILDPEPRTLLIDEADRSLRPDKDTTPDVIAILNSGYKRGSTRPVLVPVKGGGWETAEMPTFAPVAMAGNSPNLPDDTRTRTLRVLLMPDVDGTVEESDWELIEDDAARLAGRVAVWADRHRDLIRNGPRPEMPAGVTGRFREKWQPLARVAAATGGRWPAAIAAMAVADVEQVAADREDGMVTDRPHVILLQHLAEVWPSQQRFASTHHLIAELVDGWPKVWSASSAFGKDLTAQRLGRMLASHYKVNSAHSEDKSVRGYRYAALLGAWTRMGVKPPPPPPDPSKPPKPPEPPGRERDGSDGSDTPDGSRGTPCPVCGRPNTHERHAAGLECPQCFADRCEPDGADQ